jgi:hypothetical protein
LYGDGSPQYQQAKQMFDLDIDSDKSRIGYQNALAGSMDKRYLTQMGKSIVEQKNVSQGLSPQGNQDGYLNDDQKQQLADSYALHIQKMATDADTRNRNLYATNIEKTLDLIDPDALVQYAGASGTVNKILNQIAAPFGEESSDYDKFSTNLNNIGYLQKQVRAFTKDSIDPSVQEKFSSLLNPATWRTNPKLAKQMFLELENVLRNDTKTYREALVSRKPYLGIDEKGVPLLENKDMKPQQKALPKAPRKMIQDPNNPSKLIFEVSQ